MKRLAVAVALAALGVGVNAWAATTDAQVDLSEADRFTLTEETRDILGAVEDELRISVFLNLEGGAARDARFLLDRYEDVQGHVDYRIVDPDRQPAEARRLGVDEYSTVVLEYRGRRVDAPTVDELQISSAVLRLVRGEVRDVCVLVGHGEAALGDEGQLGLSEFGLMLERNAFRPRLLDLSRRRQVPEECAAVAVVGPRVAFLDGEVRALQRYARSGGDLFVALSPLTEGDPNPLLRPWGVLFNAGLVIDEARSEGTDLANLIIESFPTTNPVVEGVPRLQFPAAGFLLPDPAPEEGRAVAFLAETSEDSYWEATPEDDLAYTPDRGDLPGPLPVAVAVDASEVVDDDSIRRTRMVVTATAEWVTNDFLNKLGNRRFATNALNWLTEVEQVLAAPEFVDPVRPLPWTAERQFQVVLVTVGLVPGAVVAVGLAVFLVVRRRERR